MPLQKLDSQLAKRHDLIRRMIRTSKMRDNFNPMRFPSTLDKSQTTFVLTSSVNIREIRDELIEYHESPDVLKEVSFDDLPQNIRIGMAFMYSDVVFVESFTSFGRYLGSSVLVLSLDQAGNISDDSRLMSYPWS